MKLGMRRRGLLESTIAKREINIRALMRWAGPRSVFELGLGDVQQFLDERHIGPRTRFTWLANLHSFYTWAASEGLTTTDPTEEIVRPKLRRSLPRPAGSAELERVLVLAPPKERCWVLLAAYQGLRCQEIAGLRREDVLEDGELLRVVHGKGQAERILPLASGVLSALRALPMPRSGWVFTRIRGGPYTPNAMSLYFNAFLRDAGASFTAHQLRHAFATRIYQSTHDLRLTQELLGHSDPSTTSVYTAFSRRDARAAIEGLDFGGAGEDTGAA